jgi:hypothetical protein
MKILFGGLFSIRVKKMKLISILEYRLEILRFVSYKVTSHCQSSKNHGEVH